MAPGFRHQNVGELFRPERYTLNINTNTSLFHHLTLPFIVTDTKSMSEIIP